MNEVSKPKKCESIVMWVAYVKAGDTHEEQAKRAGQALEDMDFCQAKITALRVRAVKGMHTKEGHTLRSSAAALNLSPTRIQQMLAEAG